MSQEALAQVLRQLPKMPPDPRLLVGAATADDAGIYRIDCDRALVQTVDFFTPIVDNPFTYGQIAAANSISDVYAMGGRPLTALNLLGVPTETVPPAVISRILSGGLRVAKEAQCTVLGGHTIRNPEPFYGMAVTGLISPRKIIANANARPGDLLVLTKPLGTGIITTGIKLGITPRALERKAVKVMCHLNREGALLAEKGWVRAGTDVTGFGLLGHLATICRASGVSAELDVSSIPSFGKGVLALIEQDCIPGGSRQNLRTADSVTDWGRATVAQKHLLTDAQTSGGLLLCVAPKRLKVVLALLARNGAPCAAVIGRISHSRAPLVRVVG
ncbi:MAG: selenide, water dikinase SelD [Verrucomicrobiia bacterium]